MSDNLKFLVANYSNELQSLGSFVLIDSEQTYKKLPFMFTIIWCRTKTIEEETILIEEVLDDDNVLGGIDGKSHDRASRMKMFLTCINGSVPYRKMKYRDFLMYIFKRASNGGPIPMVSHCRHNDLSSMYNLDQYLPGDKFFTSDPCKNPIECSYNKTWKHFVPQVCTMMIFSELCPNLYKREFTPYCDPLRKNEADGPNTLSSVMRRIHPEFVPTHRSDGDVEALFEALLFARCIDTFEIPRTNYLVMLPPSKVLTSPVSKCLFNFPVE